MPSRESDITRVLRALLFCVVALVGALLYGWPLPEASVSLQMRSTTGSAGEIFFASGQQAYASSHSVSFHLVPDGAWHDYIVALPSEPIDRIRLDPGNTPGDVTLRSITVRSGRKAEVFDATELLQARGIVHDLATTSTTDGTLQLRASSNDPYFDIRLPRPIGIDLQGRLRRFMAFGAAAFGVWLGIEALLAFVRRDRGRDTRVSRILAAAGAAVSDDALLRVDRRLVLTIAALALLAAAYVGARLNQSSIGIWGTTYPAAPAEALGELGTPKRIRSDEWKVLTPWVFNQVLRGYPERNPNVGGAEAPLLASVPIDGALGAPQLKFAGFRLFGLDRGLSWWWAYKSFGLLLSVFWLCLLLTRGNFAASVLGAAWIYASSFTQWWFSSDLPEILIAFALGTVGAMYALFSARRRLVVLGCALIVYAAANLLQNLYPPFIVTLGYLAVAILAGHAWRIGAFASLRHGLAFRAGALGVAALLIIGYATLFAHAAAASIDVMRHTVYPGQRIAGSGGVSPAKLLYGMFETFRIHERQVPLPALSSNACEASTFVLLFPLVVLAFPWIASRRRDAALPLAIMAFCLLALVWSGVHLVAAIELPLQALGWSLVTPKRAVFALGVGSILACVVAFAAAKESRDEVPGPQRAMRVLGLVALAAGVVFFGLALRKADPEFFTVHVLVFGIAACLFTGAGLLFGRTALLATGVAVFALPTLSVNPLARGIAPLAGKPILLAAERQGNAPGDTWSVIGDNFLAQGLKARGLNVFGGSAYLPDPGTMQVLDPDGRYAHVWNRYATIRLVSKPGIASPVFRQTRGDQYTIGLDVCGGRLRALGVNRLAYTGRTPAADLRCLEPLAAPVGSGVTLYRLK